jgi:hypothetical protein
LGHNHPPRGNNDNGIETDILAFIPEFIWFNHKPIIYLSLKKFWVLLSNDNNLFYKN